MVSLPPTREGSPQSSVIVLESSPESKDAPSKKSSGGHSAAEKVSKLGVVEEKFDLAVGVERQLEELC